MTLAVLQQKLNFFPESCFEEIHTFDDDVEDMFENYL